MTGLQEALAIRKCGRTYVWGFAGVLGSLFGGPHVKISLIDWEGGGCNAKLVQSLAAEPASLRLGIS